VALQLESDRKLSIVLRNSAVVAAGRGIGIVATLVTVPVLVRVLGLHGYGTWEAILALGYVASMFQLPIGGAVLWQSSHAYGQGNLKQMANSCWTGLVCNVGLILVLVPLLFATNAWLTNALHIANEYREAVQRAVPWVIVGFLIIGVGETFAGVVDGCQRMDLSVSVRSFGQIASSIVFILGVINGLGFDALILGKMVEAFLTAFGHVMCALWLCGNELLLPPSVFSLTKDLKKFLGYSGQLVIGYISSALREQTDKLVLTSFASADWTGAYSIAAKMSGLVNEAVRYCYAPITAASGAMASVGDFQSLSVLYRRGSIAVGALTGFLTCLFVGFHKNIVMIWTGRWDERITPILLILAFGNLVAVAYTGVGTAICRGIGAIHLQTVFILASLFVNAVLTVILVLTIGAIGTVIASSTAWTLGSVAFVWAFSKESKLPVKQVALTTTYIVLFTLLLTAIFYIVARFA
jgi:O-antigen/teichoic acid export membrane protein